MACRANVDLEGRKIYVRQSLSRVRIEGGTTKTSLVFQEPKTEKSKASVPIPPSVVKELKAHQIRQEQEKKWFSQGNYQDNDLVLCQANGKPLDPRAFTKKYERLLVAARVPKVSFHALRNTCGTLLLDAGEELRTVQEILRHTRISTTADIYVEVTDRLKERASDKIDAVLIGSRKRKIN